MTSADNKQRVRSNAEHHLQITIDMFRRRAADRLESAQQNIKATSSESLAVAQKEIGEANGLLEAAGALQEKLNAGRFRPCTLDVLA